MPTKAKATGYASLQPHTTHVPRARIQKKWRPLPQPAQERVKQLLLVIQKESQAQQRHGPGHGHRHGHRHAYGHGPGINRNNNYYNNNSSSNNQKQKTKKQRKEDEQDERSAQAVDQVVNKLMRRIPRMPFPPRQSSSSSSNTNNNRHSYEADFDFEATLDRIQQVEAELAETIESSKLLREHIRREEAALQADRQEYKILEAGARSEQSLAREQMRKLHPVARDIVNGGNDDDGNDDDDNDDNGNDDDDNDDNDNDNDNNDNNDNDKNGEDDDGGDDDVDDFDFDFDFVIDQQAQAPTDEAGPEQVGPRRRKKNSRAARGTGLLLTRGEIEQDEQLKALVGQLRRHVHSLEINAAGPVSVSNALDEAEQSLWTLTAAPPGG